MTSALDNGAMAPHSSHWGAFFGQWVDGRLVLRPHPGDPDPNSMMQNLPDALSHRARVSQPMVRKGWLDRGPGRDSRRGHDEFVAMPWDDVLGLLAKELARVQQNHGADAIFGGSYGWSSA